MLAKPLDAPAVASPLVVARLLGAPVSSAVRRRARLAASVEVAEVADVDRRAGAVVACGAADSARLGPLAPGGERRCRRLTFVVAAAGGDQRQPADEHDDDRGRGGDPAARECDGRVSRIAVDTSRRRVTSSSGSGSSHAASRSSRASSSAIVVLTCGGGLRVPDRRADVPRGARGRGRCASARCPAARRARRRSPRSRDRRGRAAPPRPGTPRAARAARRRRRGGRPPGPRSTTRRRRVRGRLERTERRGVGRQRPPPLAPQLVEGRVGRDPVAPGGERGPAVEPADPACDGDHRLLGGVERVLGMGDDATAHAVDAVGVTVEQHLERAPVAVRRACGEDGVALVTQSLTSVTST